MAATPAFEVRRFITVYVPRQPELRQTATLENQKADSAATPGFVLQVRPAISPASWANAPSGATNPVSLSATLPARFYRPHKH